MSNIDGPQTMDNLQLAQQFAINNGLNIVSDLFGTYFVVQKEGQEAFKIAHLRKKEKGGVILGATTYAKVEDALAEVAKRGASEATAPIASVPDVAVVEAYCKANGVKASDHVHAGYVTLSKPIHDRVRDWRVYKRVGTTLVPVDGRLSDRWAANAKVRQLGGPEATGILTGAHVYPYGNNFARPSERAPAQDGKAA